MVEQHVLTAQHFKNVYMRWKRRITRRLEWPIAQICECIIRYERREMRH